MQLINHTLLLIVMFGVVAAVFFTDMFYITPKIRTKKYLLKINNLLFERLNPEQCRKYTAKKFRRYRWNKFLNLSLGAWYVYSASVCEDLDSNFEEILSCLDLTGNGIIKATLSIEQKKSLSKLLLNFYDLILGAAMMFFLRGAADIAKTLYQKIVNVSHGNTENSAVLAGMDVCKILFFSSDSEQLQGIHALLSEHESDENLSDYKKCILYFRQYQLTGDIELYSRSLSLAPYIFTQKVLRALAAGEDSEAYSEFHINQRKPQFFQKGKQTPKFPHGYIVAIVICIMIWLVIVSTLGQYFSTPEASIEFQYENATILKTVSYDDGTPVTFLVDSVGGETTLYLSTYKSSNIFGRNWWKAGWREGYYMSTIINNTVPANDIFDSSDEYTQLDDSHYILWGAYVNDFVLDTEGEQQTEAFVATIEGQEITIWYVLYNT
jgi:hypothetical protein